MVEAAAGHLLRKMQVAVEVAVGCTVEDEADCKARQVFGAAACTQRSVAEDTAGTDHERAEPAGDMQA